MLIVDERMIPEPYLLSRFLLNLWPWWSYSGTRMLHWWRWPLFPPHHAWFPPEPRSNCTIGLMNSNLSRWTKKTKKKKPQWPRDILYKQERLNCSKAEISLFEHTSVSFPRYWQLQCLKKGLQMVWLKRGHLDLSLSEKNEESIRLYHLPPSGLMFYWMFNMAFVNAGEETSMIWLLTAS